MANVSSLQDKKSQRKKNGQNTVNLKVAASHHIGFGRGWGN